MQFIVADESYTTEANYIEFQLIKIKILQWKGAKFYRLYSRSYKINATTRPIDNVQIVYSSGDENKTTNK